MNYQDILKEIEKNQQQIASYGKFDSAVLKKINYKIRLDWNYYSNRMEGGTLTREETRSVMVGNIDVKGKPFKDVAEMTGHDRVVLEVLKMSKGEIPLSEKRIKEIHKAIMYEDNIEKAQQIGVWKKTANEIINYKNEKITFTQPEDVADDVHKLLDQTNSDLEKYRKGKVTKHPLETIAQFHIDFVSIHPFYDGNGRTTRILTNILLLACGFPAIIIKDEMKQQYYQLLADIQVYDGNSDLFYDFLGERILDTQKIILNALEGKEIEDTDDLDKEITLLRKMQNPPKIKVKKSKEITKKILAEVYFPMLRAMDTGFIQINTLFRKHSWAYFEEPDEKGVPVLPRHVPLTNIIKYFIQIADQKENSYHSYKAVYTLMNYNDKNKFNVEISFKLYFNDTDYNVNVFIGQPFASGTIYKNIDKMIKAIDKEVSPSNNFKDYNLFQLEYDQTLSEKQISDFCLQIKKQVIEYVKTKVGIHNSNN